MRPNYKILVLLFIFITACGEEPDLDVTTVIHRDGSISRTVKITYGDTIKFNLDSLVIPVDTSWDIERYTYLTDSSILEYRYLNDSILKSKTKFVLEADHTYNDIEELKADYNSLGERFTDLNRRIDLKKKFRWFYTYYSYEEITPAIWPGFQYVEFFSDEEYRLMKWCNKDVPAPGFENMDSLEYAKLKEDAAERKSNIMDTILFVRVDRFFSEIMEDGDTIADFIFSHQGKDIMWYLYCDSVDVFFDSINKPEVYDLMTDDEQDSINWIFSSHFNAFRFLSSAYCYTMRLELPGELLTFAGEGIVNNIPEWNVDPTDYIIEDMVIAAESRLANIWAFVVTGILGLLMIIPFARRRSRKDPIS